MHFEELMDKMTAESGVTRSTMMKSPCLRYKGSFMAMMFEKEECLIIKVAPDRVNALIDQGVGREFNYTGKKFKEWVLIPYDGQDRYEEYIREALAYARQTAK